MSMTINSMIFAAEAKWDMWKGIVNDKEALADRQKTREEALCLSNYFEGVFDGLINARDLLK